mgnify:CR=1 FL=1
MKSMVDDEKTKDMFSDEDRDKVKSTIEDAIKWLESNQLASKDEYDHKKNEVEEVCKELISKLSSGMSGGMSGGMPNVAEEVTNNGPSIEEVD